MQNEPRPRPITHTPVYGPHGILLPWTPWNVLVEREMNWYLKCPIEHGYPRFVYMTFMDGDYKPLRARRSFIPCMQNGMGIISYLKYYAWTGESNPKMLEFARYMGDYLVKESLTPGHRQVSALHALHRHAREVSSASGLRHAGRQAIRDRARQGRHRRLRARASLRADQGQEVLRSGSAERARPGRQHGHGDLHAFALAVPRGLPYGRVSAARFPANMSFNLRLFDKLIEHGYPEFREPRAKLWTWIKNYQIPNLKDGSALGAVLRGSRGAGQSQRLVASQPGTLPDRKEGGARPRLAARCQGAHRLLDRQLSPSIRTGVPVCGEQTYDKDPWGGVLSTYGAVLAMYAAATGSHEYKALAYQALNYVPLRDQRRRLPGRPLSDRARRLAGRRPHRQDPQLRRCHAAFPEWAK